MSGIDDILKNFENESFDDKFDYHELLKEYGIDLKKIEDDFINYTPKRVLNYVKLNDDVPNPKYNYEGDSGFDLYSTEEISIPPFGRALIPTGLMFDIPDGFEIQVRSKSGLAINQGLFVLNSPGTVDCFSKDMKILAIDGEKFISELNINEVVFSLNEKTFEVEKDTVVNIFDTDVQEIIIIETEEGFLEVTPNSEVYTNNGIILAKNLKENDEIIVF